MGYEILDRLAPADFASEVVRRVAAGARFAGLFASPVVDDTRLLAVLISDDTVSVAQTLVAGAPGRYPSLRACGPAALWYEREIHDLFGLEVSEHARRDPLVVALSGTERPRPGIARVLAPLDVDDATLSLHLRGEGVFTISYGPVRSGVFESIEYVVETPGEDIPHLGVRASYKHRGVEARFAGMSIADAVLLAERVEGVASVAHAISFCAALERASGSEVPVEASLVRVMHAELERVANHLDSTVRHTEAAGQAVAYARFARHKEEIQRLRARLCGSRFGRGVVVPGGVEGAPLLGHADLTTALAALRYEVDADTRLLMNTPSFIDRLRGTGVVSTQLARRFGAVGPVARGSGVEEDTRLTRPYAAYEELGMESSQVRGDGDALSRLRVRTAEIEQSFSLIQSAADALSSRSPVAATRWSTDLGEVTGEALGWAEAPQGEVLTWVEVDHGRVTRVKPRSASFQNMALFPAAFPKDILTDFAFIEASFGLSVAGVVN